MKLFLFSVESTRERGNFSTREEGRRVSCCFQVKLDKAYLAFFITIVKVYLVGCGSYSVVIWEQIVKDAKAGVRDGALMVVVSYDLATRMADKSLLWKGQVSGQP